MRLEDRDDEGVVRRAFVLFTALSIALLVVLAVGLVLASEVLTDRASRAQAALRGESLASAIEVGMSDTDWDPDDDSFRESVERTAAGAGVRAVLVWDESGTIVWSTRRFLVGSSYRLDPEIAGLFGESGSLVADPGERLVEASPAGLLGNETEVFSPISDADGEMLVVESYVDTNALVNSRADTILLVLPIALLALVLIEVVGLVVGTTLARRVQASRRERQRVLSASLLAVDHERRRLAHDLHDGIVQDLAAMRYALTAVAQSLPAGLPDEPRDRLLRVCDVLAEELAVLRGRLGDLLPTEMDGRPLREALHAQVQRLVPEEIDATVAVEDELTTVDRRTADIVHRVVQEGVRNAVRHAEPRSIAVRVGVLDRDAERPRVCVEVIDDGRGIRGASPDQEHFGLWLLAELVEDLEGSLEVSDVPGGGARLRAEWVRTADEDSTLVGHGGPRSRRDQH